VQRLGEWLHEQSEMIAIVLALVFVLGICVLYYKACSQLSRPRPAIRRAW